MSDELRQLLSAARQIIRCEQMLSGDLPGPGTAFARPAPAAVMAQAAPAPSSANAASAARGKPAPDKAGDAPSPSNPRASGRHFDVPAAPPKSSGEKQQLLNEIEQQVRQCRRCGLCQGRSNVVFGEGSPDAQVVFVGEAPGEEEDRQGRPFVGRAGELLTRQINAMGLQRSEIYIANVCKCRPPGNRTPLADEVEHCREHLMQQLRIIRPRVIITLGNPATHALLNTTIGITRLRGQWQKMPETDPELAGIKVMPTFHPAYLLRAYTEDNRRKVWSDLQAVMQELGLKK
jgi:uracil-DNA glycosylase